MGTLNFNSKQIISKEELIAWDKSLRKLWGSIVKYNRNKSQIAGILDAHDGTSFTNDFFKVEDGTTPHDGYATLKIAAGIGVLDVESTTDEFISAIDIANEAVSDGVISLFEYAASDNIEVGGITGYTIGGTVYVGFVPQWNPCEIGVCSISSSNQITIVGGTTERLRGQSTKNPSKVRFYESDGSTPTNHDIFEVVSVVDATTFTIAGTVSAESGLKLVIVGSYDLSAQGSLTDKSAYVETTGVLTFTETEADILSSGGFSIAKLTFTDNAGTYTITDRRSTNLFSFAWGDNVLYTDKDQTNTGQKTFSGKSPVFDVPVINGLNTATVGTPLTIAANSIALPTTAGTVFTLKCADTVNPLRTITYSGAAAGTTVYLKIDPTGTDLYLDCTAQNNGVFLYTATGALFSGVITKGSILELWKESDIGEWYILNFNSLYTATVWTQVVDIYDGSGTHLSAATNLVWYKRSGEFITVRVVSIAGTVTGPVTFSLPYTFNNDNPLVYYLASFMNLSTGHLDHQISVTPGGLCTVWFTTPGSAIDNTMFTISL